MGGSNYGTVNDAKNNYSRAFCIVGFPFYGFSKENVIFITAISKFFQDDGKRRQPDGREFHLARLWVALLPNSWPFLSPPWTLRPVNHLIACIVLTYILAWLPSFPPSTISSKILPSQFSLFTIFQLFHSSPVSCQHPGRYVSSAHTPQTNSHKVCSFLKVLEDNAVTNSETSIFSPFPLFLLIALPLSSKFPNCHRSIHFPKTISLCVGSPLKLWGTLLSFLHSPWRQKPGDIRFSRNFLTTEKLSLN